MRRFLYIVAGMVVLLLAGAVLYRIYERQLTEYAFVPRGAFIDEPALAQNAYDSLDMWYSRPGKRGQDPSRYQPERPPAEVDTQAGQDAAPIAVRQATGPDTASGETQTNASEAAPPFLVFFVHPTSYIPVALTGEARWNASLDDSEAASRARLFLRGLASPFAEAQEIWAPKYRQASFGAFLTDQPEAQLALDLAYRDVAQAFDTFIANAPPDLPIVLVGHSQGALHILTLLGDKVLSTPLQTRIAVVYPIGWPISVTHDLPALGLPACDNRQDAACIMTWSSFAEPANPGMVLDRFTSTPGFDGAPRGDGPILCINPITRTRGGSAPAEANIGTLKPAPDFSSGTLIAGAVPARCDPRTGLLLIGDPPDMGDGVLPGNNYHVYDIPLFWADLRRDVLRRVAAFSATSS